MVLIFSFFSFSYCGFPGGGVLWYGIFFSGLLSPSLFYILPHPRLPSLVRSWEIHRSYHFRFLFYFVHWDRRGLGFSFCSLLFGSLSLALANLVFWWHGVSCSVFLPSTASAVLSKLLYIMYLGNEVLADLL